MTHVKKYYKMKTEASITDIENIFERQGGYNEEKKNFYHDRSHRFGLWSHVDKCCRRNIILSVYDRQPDMRTRDFSAVYRA